MTTTDPSACPHCWHPLVGHLRENPVYADRAVFTCKCGCRIDGSTADVGRAGSEGSS